MYLAKAIPDPDLSRNNISFADLRVHHWTGRSILRSQCGRTKTYDYRNGAVTDLGDLELSEWAALAQGVIEKNEEQKLFGQLKSWLSRNHFRTQSELLYEALSLHMARIFDNPKWVNYVSFNQQYRPEVLENVCLIEIQTECCSLPGYITKEILAGQFEKRVPCPICGKLSHFFVIGTSPVK